MKIVTLPVNGRRVANCETDRKSVVNVLWHFFHNALSVEIKPRGKGNGDKSGFEYSIDYSRAEKINKRFNFERKQNPDNYINKERRIEGKSGRRPTYTRLNYKEREESCMMAEDQ